jgi:undecaprenyl-diphosphatase
METASEPIAITSPSSARGVHPHTDDFDAPPGSLSERIGRRFPGHPVRVNLGVDAVGLLLMTTLLIGLGVLMTNVLLDGGLGRWDVELNRRFVQTRSPIVNRWSDLGSSLGDTVTVVGVAAIVTGILLLRRAWAHASFLVGALLIEFLSFVTTTFVIDRNRPPVPKLDAAPPTASFPSGHAAAAIVLYVAIAIILASWTRNRILRVVTWIVAVILPAAVAISRMHRGMHHPTDIAGSLIGALGALAVSMLAVRAACASARATHDDREEVAA